MSNNTSTTFNIYIGIAAFLLSAAIVLLLWNWLAVPAVANPIDYGEALVIQAVLSAVSAVSRLVEWKVTGK